jgi:chromosome condensin MukBEF complex kleisin-like MukF subunit
LFQLLGEEVSRIDSERNELMKENRQLRETLKASKEKLSDTLLSIEEICSGTDEEAMVIQKIIDSSIR